MKILTILMLFIAEYSTAQDFPTSYKGSWKGSLEIYKPSGEIGLSVPMELIIDSITPTNWQWKTIYNNTDVRDYNLNIIHKEKGHFQIDEKNGIVLESRLFGNKLFTSFTIEGFTISDTYLFKPESIEFELISSDQNFNTISGNKDEIPLVVSHTNQAYQKAILKKVH